MPCSMLGLCLLLWAAPSWAAAPEPDASLDPLTTRKSTSPHHPTIMGFSGWDPAHQFGWTNLHLSRDMAAISAAHKQYSWSTLYDDLPRDGTIFAAKTESTPQPGYKWALAKLANDTLLPGLASGALSGVFIGDEICCGHSECWPQLDAVATALRQLVGPKAILYLNECALDHEWEFSGSIPEALDYISVDLYANLGVEEAADAKAFYEKNVLHRLKAHQKALVMPGTFACSAYPNKRFASLDESQDKTIDGLRGFYNWSKAEPRIAGIVPWHFSNRAGPQVNTSSPGYSGCDLELGAIAMPRVMEELLRIGKEILSSSQDDATMAAITEDGIDVTLLPEFRASSAGPTINDTLTIQRAIDLAAAGHGRGVVLLAAGQTFVTWPLKLASNIKLVIDGTLATSGDPHQYCNTAPCKAILWAADATNLTVTSSKKGLGEIFGNGSAWWPLRKLNYKFWAPQIFSCDHCRQVRLSNFRVLDSPAWCLENSDAKDLVLEDLEIIAPRTSPNTDGIGIGCSGGPDQPCIVRNCRVSNGDDEVAIGGQNVLVENCHFASGHGASIGSLGYNGSTAYVSNVTIRGVTFNGTSTSIRIKTWQGGHGLVQNITYKDIVMINAGLPIYITQYYCPGSQHSGVCKNMTSVVKVAAVTIRNVSGTHIGDYAGQFLCSDTPGSCEGIVLDNVHLVADRAHVPPSSNRFLCWKAHGEATDVTPTPCLTAPSGL